MSFTSPGKKTVALIQARMGSSRLPGKVMRSILGKPMLFYMLRRLSYADSLDDVVVITTTNREDNVIVEFCETQNISFFRGHPTNLLLRHLDAASAYNADILLKIPSDCPLIDPAIVDLLVNEFKIRGNLDYLSNLHPFTLPDGMDVEIFTKTALVKASKLASSKADFEHTTTLFWKNKINFNSENFVFHTKFKLNEKMRLTVDYEEDFNLIKCIIERLFLKNEKFSVYDIIDLVVGDASLLSMNSMHIGDIWYLKPH